MSKGYHPCSLQPESDCSSAVSTRMFRTESAGESERNQCSRNYATATGEAEQSRLAERD